MSQVTFQKAEITVAIQKVQFITSKYNFVDLITKLGWYTYKAEVAGYNIRLQSARGDLRLGIFHTGKTPCKLAQNCWHRSLWTWSIGSCLGRVCGFSGHHSCWTHPSFDLIHPPPSTHHHPFHLLAIPSRLPHQLTRVSRPVHQHHHMQGQPSCWCSGSEGFVHCQRFFCNCCKAVMACLILPLILLILPLLGCSRILLLSSRVHQCYMPRSCHRFIKSWQYTQPVYEMQQMSFGLWKAQDILKIVPPFYVLYTLQCIPSNLYF